MANEAEVSGAPPTQLEQELAKMKRALALLGARPCSVCGTYYLTSNPGNLVHAGAERVCYICLSGWWLERSHELGIPEREAIEHKLMHWLTEYRDGKVYRELRDLPPSELQNVHLVVSCPECAGTGKLGGERCRHCLGNRNVWVITFKMPQPAR